jgi:RHH-type rel operon transcriptional repressor/antitoxin RelB
MPGAKRTGRSNSPYARDAIVEHLEELEDFYLAEEALHEHYTSGGPTIPMEQVMERSGE